MKFKESVVYIDNFIKEVKEKDETKSGASFVFENVTTKDLELLAYHYIEKKYHVKTSYTEVLDYSAKGIPKYTTQGDIYIKWK